VTTVDEIDVLRVVHHVRILHGGTGRPYDRVAARLVEPAWRGWVMRLRGADLVLATYDRFAAEEPAQTQVDVTVTDEHALERFANDGVAQVTLQSGAPRDSELVLDPAPVTLEVAVVDKQGAPRTGRIVEARGNGKVVQLPEDAQRPGTYVAAATSWTPGQQPFRIFVNNQQRGQAALDYERPITRVRVVDS
jgi:hypothetical protein